MTQHLPRGANLVAVLDQSSSARGEVFRVIHDGVSGAQGSGKAGNINNGVQLGQIHEFQVNSPRRHGEHGGMRSKDFILFWSCMKTGEKASILILSVLGAS